MTDIIILFDYLFLSLSILRIAIAPNFILSFE